MKTETFEDPVVVVPAAATPAPVLEGEVPAARLRVFRHVNGDVITVGPELVSHYSNQPNWTEVLADSKEG